MQLNAFSVCFFLFVCLQVVELELSLAVSTYDFGYSFAVHLKNFMVVVLKLSIQNFYSCLISYFELPFILLHLEYVLVVKIACRREIQNRKMCPNKD